MRHVIVHTAVFFLLAFLCLPALAQEQGKGRLFVETNVNEAVISLLHQKTTFRQGISLEPGMYVVQVAAEGYAPKTKTVTVLAGKEVRLRVNLEQGQAEEKTPAEAKPVSEERKKGSSRLFVKTTPKDATVRILNIAPKFQQGMELKPGDYEIEVKKEGLGEVVRNVVLRKDEDLTLSVNLEAETKQKTASPEEAKPEKDAKDEQGRLFVKASPDNSRIKLLGIDPVFKQGIKLAPGKYRIEVSRAGYQKTEITAEVFAGKDTRVAITLVPDTPVPGDFPPQALEDGKTATISAGKTKERLYVVSLPEKSNVRILNIVPKFEQGIEVGDGEYEVEVSHDKYETQVRMVTVPKGKHLAAGFDLRPPEERMRGKEQGKESLAQAPAVSDPTKGQLFVETDVEGAEVNLMDLKQAFAQGMELAPGSYRIEVFKDNVGRKEAMAVVSSGKASHVKVLLQPPPPPPETEERERMQQERKLLIDEARTAERARDFNKALEIISKALELDPRYAKSYKIRGDIFLAREEYEKALADYNRSIELYPHTASPYLARGKVHAILEDPESACYDFWKACALERCEGIATAKKQGLCR